jgi:hypothetical protein
MLSRLSCAFAILTALDATSAWAETEVRIDLDPATETTGRGPTEAHTSLTVTLGEKSMVVRSPEKTIVYDFERRKFVVMDPTTRTQVEYSLYAPVAFAVLELQNRNMLAKVLGAAKLDKAVTTLAENEHALGIQDKPSQPLRVATESSDTVFSSETRVLARVSNDGTAVPPSDARMFTQFVRHRIAVHPQVLAALIESSRIPARIIVTNLDPGPVTRTLTVTSVGPSSEAPPDIAAFRARLPADDTDPVDAILDRAASFTPQQIGAARQKSMDDMAAAFRDGRILDALLAFVEGNLINGEGMPSLSAEQKVSIQSDPAVRKYLSVIGATKKDSLPAAIATLDEIRPQAVSKGYMIDLAKANDVRILGNFAAAQTQFIGVLQANPYIGSVYKDLGDALLGQWDATRAWRSFDVGRRIAPRVSSFSAVDQFERSLLAAHPEYF